MRWVVSVSVAALVGSLGIFAGCADEEWPSGQKRDSSVDSRQSSDGSVNADASVGADASGDANGIADMSVADASMRGDAEGGEGPRPVDMACRKSRSAEPIPARSVVTSADAGLTVETRFVGTDLFESNFRPACGGCHVEASFGGLQVSLADFRPGSARVGQNMLDRMEEERPALVMPPLYAGGKAKSQRGPGDPVTKLIELYRQWLMAGQPADTFQVAGTSLSPDDSNRYVMPQERGEAMTNIGDCVPGSGLVGAASMPTRAQQLDAKFAALTKAPPGSNTSVPERIGLPQRLAETDLYTLDSRLLAEDRVIAYAPTYPLWSDSARKIRHIRVPLGQSIRFDKQTQTFDIPPNTRFYKTFLKPVVEKGGSIRYRKVETRLIVARSDVDGPDRKVQSKALFGTYEWDESEREATLVTSTLNNGEPFKDKLLTLVTDEAKEEQVRKSTPAGVNIATELQKARATRKYAIPGSERCIQCHMGSPTKDFILGFFPLQVRRRPAGEGGVIEPAGPDELTQLERLVSYGIISGVNSPADVTPLEESQGMRLPRNDYELTAQGYVLGNCAHCHNPRGFPSVENPVLRDIFDFLPDAAPVEAAEGCRKQGGIFQFPLGCMSPRILRGYSGDIPIPYITPSLVDYPVDPDDTNYIRKTGVFAPWRSLIYRNVDTPFTYADHGAIFPHMPVNTPGFDCRAPRVLGEWMVSIPSFHPLNPSQDEFHFSDPAPQPYKEVFPGDAVYARAVADAQARLARYQWGIGDAWWQYKRLSRHSFCPDTSDIQDPFVTLEDDQHLVPPDEHTRAAAPDGGGEGEIIMPSVGTPRRAHWVVTDLTLPRTESWNPRRDDWKKVLIHDCLCSEKKTECRNPDGRVNKTYDCVNTDQDPTKIEAQLRVIGLLKGSDPAGGVHLTNDFRTLASEPIPFGLWKKRSDCNYGSVHTVGWWRRPPPARAKDRPRWVDVAPQPPDDAPVYEVSRGAAVFGMICINCHGNQADSRGRMADTVLTMTGGSSRVASFRDGLFGAAGANRATAFGSVANTQVSIDDWAARYLAWMALGGTNKLIPPPVLKLIANTLVLGEKRKGVTAAADPNMLESAKQLCRYILPSVTINGIHFDPKAGSLDYTTGSPTPLIYSNGDLELWQRLCTEGNSVPIRRLIYYSTGAGVPGHLGMDIVMRPDNYGAAPIGNHLGKIDSNGVQPGNLFPWCWDNSNSDLEADATKYAVEHAIDGKDLPRCPPGYRIQDGEENIFPIEAREAWVERGAINAGLAVFVYVDRLTKGLEPPVSNYADCPPPMTPVANDPNRPAPTH